MQILRFAQNDRLLEATKCRRDPYAAARDGLYK